MSFHQVYPHLLVVRTILFSVISPGVSSLTGSKNNFVQSFHQGYPHLLVVRTILFSVISPGVSSLTGSKNNFVQCHFTRGILTYW